MSETGTVGILSMNIGNPSSERAGRQLQWLESRGEDVLVLTETAASRGCDLLAECLRGAGWEVRFPLPAAGERGVMIASRVTLDERGKDVLAYLPARAERSVLAGGLLELLGVYVPSRDASAAKTQRKRSFLEGLAAAVAPAPERGVLIGDLNIIEPGHQPHYGWFADWEYDSYRGLLSGGWVDAYRLLAPEAIEHSWVGHEGDGYRYDHAFVSSELAGRVLQCAYVHETRELELTDHSAMRLVLELAGAQPLAVEESLSGDAPTLF
jgi:exodeoxyribonuclease-3